MLSIKECRKLIPDSEKMSDEEIVKVRNALQEFADLAIDIVLEKRNRKMMDTQSKKVA